MNFVTIGQFNIHDDIAFTNISINLKHEYLSDQCEPKFGLPFKQTLKQL